MTNDQRTLKILESVQLYKKDAITILELKITIRAHLGHAYASGQKSVEHLIPIQEDMGR